MIVAAPNVPISGDVLDPIVRRIVGRKIQRLVSAGVVHRQDALDVEHDLYLRVLRSWPSFDPERSHAYAFATMVVERAVASMVRDRRAEKRDPARLARLATDSAFHSVACDQVALTADVATVIEQLPLELRSLAEQLKHSSVCQVARDTNTARTTVYRQVRRLRWRFEEAGLADPIPEGPL